MIDKSVSYVIYQTKIFLVNLSKFTFHIHFYNRLHTVFYV